MRRDASGLRIDKQHRNMRPAYYEIFAKKSVTLCTYVNNGFLLDELEDWFDRKDMNDVRTREELVERMIGFKTSHHIDQMKVTQAVAEWRTTLPDEANAIPKKFDKIRNQIYEEKILYVLGRMIIEYGKSKGRFAS